MSTISVASIGSQYYCIIGYEYEEIVVKSRSEPSPASDAIFGRHHPLVAWNRWCDLIIYWISSKKYWIIHHLSALEHSKILFCVSSISTSPTFTMRVSQFTALAAALAGFVTAAPAPADYTGYGQYGAYGRMFCLLSFRKQVTNILTNTKTTPQARPRALPQVLHRQDTEVIGKLTLLWLATLEIALGPGSPCCFRINMLTIWKLVITAPTRRNERLFLGPIQQTMVIMG